MNSDSRMISCIPFQHISKKLDFGVCHIWYFIKKNFFVHYFHFKRPALQLSYLLFVQTVFDARTMICIENEHFIINKFLLLIVGLWPYHRSKLVELQLFLFLTILISFIIFMVCIILIKHHYIFCCYILYVTCVIFSCVI